MGWAKKVWVTAVLLSACGGGGSTSLATVTPERVLLRTTDVPTGFAVVEADPGLGSDGLCGQANLDSIARPVVRAQVLYRQGLLGTSLYQVVSRYATLADAQRVVQAIRGQLRDCHDPNDDYRVASLSAPNLGDETVAVRITGTSLGVVEMVIFRQDVVVENVGQAGIVLTDSSLTITTARKAHNGLV